MRIVVQGCYFQTFGPENLKQTGIQTGKMNIFSLPADVARLIFIEAEKRLTGTRLVCPFVCRSFRDLTRGIKWADVYSDDKRTAGIAVFFNEKTKGANNLTFLSLMGAVGSGGHVSLLQWLPRRKVLRSISQACHAAARRGHVDVLRWSDQNGKPIEPEICKWAAQEGHLVVLQFAKERGVILSPEICSSAAAGGRLSVLEWAHNQGLPIDKRVCESAAMSGHLNVLKWARTMGADWDEEVLPRAAYFGHLELFQWASANGAPWNTLVCTQAAKGGCLSILQWALERNAPFVLDIVYVAATHGHLTLLKWVLEWSMGPSCFENIRHTMTENLSQIERQVLTNASLNGHLSILKWVKENAVLWGRRGEIDWTHCVYLPAMGYLPILQWAHENGAPVPEELEREAQRYGLNHTLRWISEIKKRQKDH